MNDEHTHDHHDPEERTHQLTTANNALTPIAGTNGHQQFISFDRSQPLQLSVTNASGQVRVTGSTQEGVWLVVRRTDGNPDEAETTIPITVSISDNSISIHPDWNVAGGFSALAKKIKDQLQYGLNPSDWDISNFRLNTDLNYDMRVEIPMDLVDDSKITVKTASGAVTLNSIAANTSVATASGAISASGLTGIVSAHSASGAIALEQVNGSLEANAVSGAISLRGGEAWSALRTVSGRIQVDEFTMKHARVATVSGAVSARIAANNAQTYNFSTISGRVQLDVTVPASVSSSLVSRSASGSANAGGDWVPVERRHWTMGTGETGPAFDIKTVSGALECSGHLDGAMLALHEPLPDMEAARDAGDSPSHEPDDASSHGKETQGAGTPFDMNMDLDGLASWAKDFARDFKKNFSSLATPPEPMEPEQPAPPTPPQAPGTPPAPPAGSPAPWTWSTTAGDTSPAGAASEQTTPPNAADTALVPPAPDHSTETTPATPAASTSEPAPSDTPPNAADTALVTPEPDHTEETAPIVPEPANTVDTASKAGVLDPQDAERLKVLEALERGEIDVDEALSKLDPGSTQGR